MKLRCIVVDDESLARKLLEENINQLPFLELVGTCKNAFEAMEILQDNEVDLMFLDIQMPGLIGTKFIETLQEKPLIVFVTAYANYAVESYDLNVVDYILKPVSMERFTKAAMKALEEKEKLDAIKSAEFIVSKTNNSLADYIFVNADYALVKIQISEILYLESMKDYVKIFLSSLTKPVITKLTLKYFEEKLSYPPFIRVHKSYIVNLGKIDSIRNLNISIGTSQIPISDGYAEVVMKVVKEMK